MGYLKGFLVSFAQTGRQAARHHLLPGGEARPSRSASTAATSSTATRTAWRSASAASCAPASARPSASTCAAPTTPATRRSARRALRLRLRDQLPALHPLRPVRRGLPHRGDHRVEAVRVLLHQPARRHLHEGRAARRRRAASPSSCRGRTGASGEDDYTSAWMRATAPSGNAAYEGRVAWSRRARLRRARPREAASRPRTTTATEPAFYETDGQPGQGEARSSPRRRREPRPWEPDAEEVDRLMAASSSRSAR